MPAKSKSDRFHDLRDIEGSPEPDKRLNILILADDRHPANVVQDHINAFKQDTRFNFIVVNPIHEKIKIRGIFENIDIVLVHYSIYILGEYFLPPEWGYAVKRFPGPKAQIIQDEYRNIEPMKRRMNELGIMSVFSSLDVANLKKVYSGHFMASTSFYSCLPGYIAESFKHLDPPPISERPLDIVYRGRDIQFELGRVAQEKRIIGEQMSEVAPEYLLNVDIAWDEESRVYGDNWNNFLSSGRATLGVEGGASIFDFQGSVSTQVNEYQDAKPDADFEEVWENVLSYYEGNVVHKTITPKLFEAIAAKTALILYPGSYRGVLRSNRHYIPLERDLSNIDDVVRSVRDTAYLQNLVDRTYEEIINQHQLSMDFYVHQIDHVLADLYATRAGTISWIHIVGLKINCWGGAFVILKWKFVKGKYDTLKHGARRFIDILLRPTSCNKNNTSLH